MRSPSTSDWNKNKIERIWQKRARRALQRLKWNLPGQSRAQLTHTQHFRKQFSCNRMISYALCWNTNVTVWRHRRCHCRHRQLLLIVCSLHCSVVVFSFFLFLFIQSWARLFIVFVVPWCVLGVLQKRDKIRSKGIYIFSSVSLRKWNKNENLLH